MSNATLFPQESKNERKTENLVRKHFQKYNSEITIEEQMSDSPRIQKLLKSASKTGTGRGKPEFIIQFHDNPDLLAVIECKADIQQHESSSHDQYEDYAVDGALNYALHLSKEYDVLAIGVSGITEQNLKVSHFLQLKGDGTPEPIFSDYLLPPQDYITGYINDPRKYQKDYESLLVFAKSLNKRLHTNKVSESNRSLLISAILIALERQSFRNAYKSENNPTQLSKMLIDAVKIQLQDSGVPLNRLNVLVGKFDFIKDETMLQQEQGELCSIIEDVDKEINSFRKNHQYRDVLSGLYVEFLQYANSDKGLGIVLTPPHITSFFAKLAGVHKNSVVYDNCAGTGGFLIAAMKEMIDDASGDSKIEERIKQSQIYGVEVQSNIYPLAVSNMYINQDGKSNVLLGSCFDGQIMAKIKAQNPTVGLLNPPYKGEKTDPEELEYVRNNLACLQEGGTCVAIVPMQSALAVRGKVKQLKKDILSNHTLEAVLSMPNELFFNSDTSVVTCIMVFTAHRPHPSSKKVYLGYYKDDKFKKNKINGRFDSDNTWCDVEGEWLNCYLNRTGKKGLSVNIELDENCEWAVEKYMETDYSILSNNLFEETLLNYSTYLFGNQLSNSVSRNPSKCVVVPIPLNTDKWKLFSISDLFTVTGTKTTPIEDLEFSGHGEYPFVTTQSTNNGVRGFYNIMTESDYGILTIDSAVCGYCSYQTTPFSASDHVEKLIPEFNMDIYIAMFFVTIFNVEQYRYNYGRKCSQTRMRQAQIRLPVDTNGEPDYEFMREYISQLEYSSNLDTNTNN